MINKIEIVRGTTNTFEINVSDANGAPYNLGSGEKVVFGVKRNLDDTGVIFVKTASITGEGIFTVRLDPEDTAGLDYGRYYYDVAIDNGTDFFNIIEFSPFIIANNITYKGCADE